MDSQNLDVKTPSFIRRTITIAPAVNDAILRLRIELMRLHPDKEIDYTTVANALMAYGTVFLEKYARDEEDDQKALELVGDQSSLSEYGLGDVLDTMRRIGKNNGCQ